MDAACTQPRRFGRRELDGVITRRMNEELPEARGIAQRMAIGLYRGRKRDAFGSGAPWRV